MRVADAIWTATALLHQENPEAGDFEVQEIVSRAIKERLVGGFRPGLQPHASGHCVANKKPNGGRYRMLYETDRGRRRLLRSGDNSHPDRNGEIRPDKSELPASYQALVDWYDTIYSKQASPSSAPAVVSVARVSPQTRNVVNSHGLDSRLSQLVSTTGFVNSAGDLVIPEHFRKELGITESTPISIYREDDRLVLQPITKEFIHSLVGCCKGEDSLVEAREREHRMER